MVKVLDIPLYDKSIPAATQLLLDTIAAGGQPHSHCISATGAHGLIEASKKESFKQTLDNFYLNLPDGMPTVWVGRIKGASEMERCYGPDFFKEVMLRTADTHIKHFFCGGKEGIAAELKQTCARKFSNNNVTATFSPPFREMTDAEMEELAQCISLSGADIVWIGLSTPKQEIFAERLSKYTQTHFIITVGAAFDFHTGKVRQAPGWMQKTGLEWFFRLIMEPKRLTGRYAEIVPKFILLNIREFLHFCISKRAVK